jgi:D-beta-D-heptose 7-phosphate kinase/D-beta-D-heptose 1-phosphate adenosyltransferase
MPGIMQHLIERLERFGSPRIAVIGDFMLDRYVYGDAERISPEAPVPVLKVVREEPRMGGAANVAAGVLALGGRVACIGVLGQDAAGDELAALLTAGGAETQSVFRVPGRPTAVKVRYVGLAQHRRAQQMIRVDRETAEPIPADVAALLRAAVAGEARKGPVLVIEDYNKGVLTDQTGPAVVAEARQAGCAVLVDPALIRDYRRYRGATLLTPNRYESELASGLKITDDAALAAVARRIIEIADAQAVLITLDKEGGYLMDRGGPGRRVPSHKPRNVYDVTGAGDEVLAALAVAIAEGCTLDDAAALANVVGGLEVERFGVVPITRLEVHEELRQMMGLRGGKVLDRPELAEQVARRRREGQTIAFTNGCFDLLHMGHVRYLQQARELGSCLVVAINSDDSVRRLKGPTRPIIGQAERAEMLAALECVDYVTVFDEDTPIPLLELLRPDVLAKGGTTPFVVGRDLVEGYGGRVLTLAMVAGLSTTQIIERIAGANGEAGEKKGS